MAWQSGGGGGYPGVTSDGNQGLTIAGGVNAGGGFQGDVPAVFQFQGAVTIQDAPGTYVSGVPLLELLQLQALTVNQQGLAAIRLVRQGDTTLNDYGEPTLNAIDSTGSATAVIRAEKQGNERLIVGPEIDLQGALSSVIDLNAKAVLGSIVSLIVGSSFGVDQTT